MARPPIPVEVQQAFWRQVAAGASTQDAAATVGVSRAVGYRWVAASGGVMPRSRARERAPQHWADPCTNPGPLSAQGSPQARRLTLVDREEIAMMLRDGAGDSQIAAKLGVHRSTMEVSDVLCKGSVSAEE